LEAFPRWAHSILESGIATGSLLALTLNLVLPHPVPIADGVAQVEEHPVVH